MTEKGLSENPARDLDLEDAMMSPEEEEKQPEGEKQKTDEDVGYSKLYTKTHKKHAERSMSRVERREQDEKRKKEEATAKAAQAEADRIVQEEAKRVIERAQLEEEELGVQKNISGSCRRWKEHLGLKAQDVNGKQRKRTIKNLMMKIKIRITNPTRTWSRISLPKTHTWMMRKCLK